MARQEAESSHRLSIFWLKKRGYFNKDYSYQSGGITWSYGLSDNKNSIRFSIHRDNWGTLKEDVYIRLIYTHTDHWTGEKSDMDLKVPVTTTPCNYGGVRYWFICPLYKNGQYCGRRVGVLYSVGKWFGCRHCGNIAYQKQFEGGKYRWNGISIPDIEKAEEEVKRYYYNGKPTRKYRRLIRLNEKFESNFRMMATHLINRSR